MDNANPTILNVSQLPSRAQKRVARAGPDSKYDSIVLSHPAWADDDLSDSDGFGGDVSEDSLDEQEIYDLISTVMDPEHPHTLGELNVVRLPDIHVTPPRRGSPRGLATVLVELTPTINHCSLATIIGLAVRVRLERVLPPNYRLDVRMKDGSHAQDSEVTKQLSDKERVAAALENGTLAGMIDNMLKGCTV
ncbi:hypothetical protein QBC39DRAFT_246748 [Podospora conica]|nr:hypothetical protein QBC39DRAFT_246748 [Schizothecium conicum]